MEIGFLRNSFSILSRSTWPMLGAPDDLAALTAKELGPLDSKYCLQYLQSVEHKMDE
jgi:hypothetical protein